jgi:hypothetical protein
MFKSGSADPNQLAEHAGLIATPEQRRLRLDKQWTLRDRQLFSRPGLNACAHTSGASARRLTHTTILRWHNGRVLAKANWELSRVDDLHCAQAAP